MGYYTDYDISQNSVEVRDAIETVSQYSWDDGFMNGKWYGYEEDVLAVSENYPDEVIIVEGNGEEQGDMWVHYFKNGKSHKVKAKITYEAFDESKLH